MPTLKLPRSSCELLSDQIDTLFSATSPIRKNDHAMFKSHKLTLLLPLYLHLCSQSVLGDIGDDLATLKKRYGATIQLVGTYTFEVNGTTVIVEMENGVSMHEHHSNGSKAYVMEILSRHSQGNTWATEPYPYGTKLVLAGRGIQAIRDDKSLIIQTIAWAKKRETSWDDIPF